MNGFTVDLHNRPGEMSKVTKALADRGVNVLIFGVGTNSYGTVGFVSSDEAGARSALDDAKIGYQEIQVVTIKMHDSPGQAATVNQKLAGAGVNVALWLPVDTSSESFIVAIGVDKPDSARQVLHDQLVEWSYA